MRVQKASRANPTEELHLLRAFVRDLAKYPILPREKELDLIQKASAGDTEARRSLIEANLRYVVKNAFRYWLWAVDRYPGISLMDLIQAGCIGLITSVNKLDPEYRLRVLSYATFAIDRHMKRAVALYRRDLICSSLDTPLNENAEDGETFLDRVPAETEDPEEAAFRQDISDLVEKLKPRQKAVIVGHYWGEKTLDDIGASLNVRRERVSQIEKRALFKMRSLLEEVGGTR